MKRLAIALSLWLLVEPAGVFAETIRASIQNGTRKETGTAEKVVLFELGEGMKPLREMGPVDGSFELDAVEVAPERSYLLQLTFDGVTYNEKLTFEGGLSEVRFTVYDTTREWKDIDVAIGRVTLVRQGDQLRGQKFYVIENRTKPPRTLFEPDGTFRFSMTGQERLQSVTASHDGGMPVPRSARATSEPDGYLADVAFKPGFTELAVDYVVDYHANRYRLRDEVFYDIPRVMLLVSPQDLTFSGESWESLNAGESSRFQLLRRVDVHRGDLLEFEISGGAPAAPAAAIPAGSAIVGGGAPHGTITSLPDPSQRRRSLLVLAMALVLGIGLVLTTARRRSPVPISQSGD